MQEWKLQDKIRKALADAQGDLDEAARLLGTKPPSLERKLKYLLWAERVAVSIAGTHAALEANLAEKIAAARRMLGTGAV